MTFTAFFLIVFSAVLHASWNLVAKRSSMSLSFYTLIGVAACTIWLHVQFWTPSHKQCLSACGIPLRAECAGKCDSLYDSMQSC